MSTKAPVKNDDPIFGMVAVAVSDTVDVVPGNLCRGLWVGGSGDVKVTLADSTTVTLSAVPAGTMLPIVFSRVWNTGTTATLMVAGKA